MSGQRLDDKVFVVTGGGRGLGEATAIELGRHGATVVVNDIGVSLSGDDESAEPAKSTVDKVQASGSEGMAHLGDVSSFEYTADLVDDVIEEFGRLDGIVNYAGIIRDGISYKMDPADFDAVIEVHLRGHFCLLRNAATHWRERAREAENGTLDAQRSFVSVVSPAIWGNPGQINYASAKAGVLGLTRTAAVELSRHNVRVNALMPLGFTRMVEAIPEDKRSVDPDDIPPEKVAPVAAYLLSDAAANITGCTIRAAGNEIGIVSNPEIVRRAYDNDGWSFDDLAERLETDVAQGIDLDNSTPDFGP